MDKEVDRFQDALRAMMEEAGFQVFSVYAPGSDNDPNAIIEAIFLGRSEDVLKAAAMSLLSADKNEPVH